MTVAAPPPSGISGLTPTQVRSQLLRMGWPCVLPIVAHDANAHNGRGKAPGIRKWAVRAVFEGDATTTAELADWQKRERQWPGTGLGCGGVVAIDIDLAADADRAADAVRIAFEVFGETPFIRQGQAPKVALIYRAAEPIQSQHLKVADGSGDGLDVLGEGTQFVAIGVHSKTLKPYIWIGAETPLTAGPDEAPEITVAQVDAFLARMRGVMELNSTGGRAGKGRGNGGDGQIVRDETGRVIDGREFHLTRTVYAVALAMRAENAELTVATLTDRAWASFTASTLLTDDRWTPEAVKVKALALLDRARRGLVSLDPKPVEVEPAAEPTYPDLRRSLAEAEAETRAVVAAFFETHAPAWKAERATWEVEAAEAKEAGLPVLAEPIPTAWAARVETALGKTALAIAEAAKAAKAGLRVVYAAPMHSLLSELSERFAAEGVEAKVYRGYTSDDPDAPGNAMCLDLAAVQDARDAGGDVRSTVCETKAGTVKLRCPFFDQCGMQRQRKAKPAVWLIPHALLFHKRPSFIPAPDALVIDEGFAMSALPDKAARLSLDAIERAPIQPDEQSNVVSFAANDLESARGSLLRALRDHKDDGPLQRDVLVRHGVTASVARHAYKLEWSRRRDPGITPGMPKKARRAMVAAVGQHNKDVIALAGLWTELRIFLEAGAELSGRLCLRFDGESNARNVERRSLDTVRSSWQAPALLLDATLPAPALVEPVLHQSVEIRADITARWSAHVAVRQIVGAPVTARKLGIVERQEAETPRRSVTDLLRLIRLRAALVAPRVVVVIGPQALIGILREIGLPENVEAGHFGAIAGIDRWAGAAGLICIGRQQPGPRVVEPLAGIITGKAIEPLPEGESGGVWYPRAEGAIRLTSGRCIRVEHERHPDPVAEALRWQITEANIIQAIGRLRALRRGPDAPAFLDIINDVPLPVSVGAVVPWDEARVGAWAEMATEGVLMESPADIEACFPELAPTRKTAREVALPTMALTSIREIYIDVRAIVTAGENKPETGLPDPSIGVPTIVRWATYKRLGRYAPARVLLLPNAPADLHSWLFDRLGALAWVKIEEPEAPAAQTGSATAPKPATASPPPAEERAMPPESRPRAPLLRTADYDLELVASFRPVVDIAPNPQRPALVRPGLRRWHPPARGEVIRFPAAIRRHLAASPGPHRLEAAE